MVHTPGGGGGAHVGGCTSEQCITDAIDRLCVKRLGSLTSENMKSLLFSYDGNGDGRLEFKELKALLTDADALVPFMPNKAPTGIIDKMDTDGDRAINWDEFTAAVPKYAGAAAAPAEAAPDPASELVTINRILRPNVVARNVSAPVARVTNVAVDQAAAQVQSGGGGSFPVIPVAVGAALLGAFLLFK